MKLYYLSSNHRISVLQKAKNVLKFLGKKSKNFFIATCTSIIVIMGCSAEPGVGPNSTVELYKYSQNLGTDECFTVLFDDVNNDNLLDAFIINFKSSSKLWINNGNGKFTYSGTSFGSGYGHGGALGDIDGDGDKDLVIVSTMAPDKVYINNGGLNFTEIQSLGGSSDFTVQCLLVDIDNDGDLDLLTAHTNNSNKVWKNDGTGNFELALQIGGSSSYFMDCADIDSDGDLDIYIEMNNNADEIWLNDGNGNFMNSGKEFSNATGNGHGKFFDINKFK